MKKRKYRIIERCYGGNVRYEPQKLMHYFGGLIKRWESMLGEYQSYCDEKAAREIIRLDGPEFNYTRIIPVL